MRNNEDTRVVFRTCVADVPHEVLDTHDCMKVLVGRRSLVEVSRLRLICVSSAQLRMAVRDSFCLAFMTRVCSFLLTCNAA
jgi:hypothetical protein